MTTNLRLLRGLVLGLSAAILACASNNAFKEKYQSSLERWPSGEVNRLLPSEGKVDIVTSTDTQRDAIKMMENGYLLLGRSKFRSQQVDADAAREVARELGASVVLLRKQYATTVQGAVATERWFPSSRADAPVTDPSRPEAPSAQTVDQNARATVQGEFRTTYVPQTIDYYDFAATFWAKSKPPIFGVLVEAPGPHIREKTGGSGVVVRAVINDSPAASAGVLGGDVIVKFAGTDIGGTDQFFDTVVKNAGKEVDVDLLRGSDTKKLHLKLKTDL